MTAMKLLEGAYDIHVHAAPDVVPRAMDLEMMTAVGFTRAELRQMVVQNPKHLLEG